MIIHRICLYQQSSKLQQYTSPIQYKSMDFANQLQTHQLQRRLQTKKQERVKNKIKNLQKEKVNLDHSQLKTGKIEKTKFIKKKTYDTEFQKARKIQVEIQDNANPSTYIGESQQYLNILARTKNKVSFDREKLQNGCRAIAAFAQTSKQTVLTVQITMENEIVCHETPVLLKLPHTETECNCIVLTAKKDELENKDINAADMKIMDLKEFLTKNKEDKKFKRDITRKLTRIFCDFRIFTKSKVIRKMIGANRPVFPIDMRKVPFSVQDQLKTYKEYVNFLLGASFAVTRSGQQHRVRLKIKHYTKLADNIEAVVHQMVARLIQKNKNKGNRLVKAVIKTDTSIPIDIYE